MIYAFEYPDWPVAPTIEAFEVLADSGVALGARHTSVFGNLIHSVHREGFVFTWEVSSQE